MKIRFLPSKDPQECLKQFFRPPTDTDALKPSAFFSTLYLLRREAAQCLGLDPNTMEQPVQPAGCPSIPRLLIPGTLTVFAGIDLLAKFHDDDDNTRKAGARFRKYMGGEFIGKCSEEDQWNLWRIRNALMHSFGLCTPAKKAEKDKPDEPEYRFFLTANPHLVLDVNNRNGIRFVRLDVIRLWCAFEASIVPFRKTMEDSLNKNEKPNFMRLMNNYGFVYIS